MPASVGNMEPACCRPVNCHRRDFMRRTQTLGAAAAPVRRESREQSRPREHEIEDSLEACVEIKFRAPDAIDATC